jgi:hypothetical protein
VLVPAAANGDLWMTFEWINKYQKSFKYHLPIIVDPFKLLVILEDRRWIKNWRHTTKYTEIYRRYCPLPCFDTRGCVWQIGYVWKLCCIPQIAKQLIGSCVQLFSLQAIISGEVVVKYLNLVWRLKNFHSWVFF